jgi:PAT family beta-lactamase induction signal transducer AmpG
MLKNNRPEALGRAARAAAAALSLYTRPRLISVLFLGFSPGLPLARSGNTLKVWLADDGLDLPTIGLLSLAGVPYSVNSLAGQPPWPPARLVALQLLLLAAVLLLGARDPRAAPLSRGLCALLVAPAAATQDIVIDAHRWKSSLRRSRLPGWQAMSPPCASACR